MKDQNGGASDTLRISVRCEGFASQVLFRRFRLLGEDLAFLFSFSTQLLVSGILDLHLIVPLSRKRIFRI